MEVNTQFVFDYENYFKTGTSLIAQNTDDLDIFFPVSAPAVVVEDFPLMSVSEMMHEFQNFYNDLAAKENNNNNNVTSMEMICPPAESQEEEVKPPAVSELPPKKRLKVFMSGKLYVDEPKEKPKAVEIVEDSDCEAEEANPKPRKPVKIKMVFKKQEQKPTVPISKHKPKEVFYHVFSKSALLNSKIINK